MVTWSVLLGVLTAREHRGIRGGCLSAGGVVRPATIRKYLWPSR
jgi:hypothetical protein